MTKKNILDYLKFGILIGVNEYIWFHLLYYTSPHKFCAWNWINLNSLFFLKNTGDNCLFQLLRRSIVLIISVKK